MQTISEQEVGCTDVALGWSSRIMGLTRVLGGIMFFALLHNPVQAGRSVTFAWDRNFETNIADYRIYYGGASRTYTNMVSTGSATSVTIGNLAEGVTYYFAATAYSILGRESDFSDEIGYLVPMAAVVRVRVAPAGQTLLTVTGPIGGTYDIQASQDLKTWTSIGTVTVGTGGVLNFADTNAAAFSKRFYRTREIPL
jgi:fibronectin type III domain protein